jgi:hypothetical protein
MAQQFCQQYDMDCGFGEEGRFENSAGCVAAYDANQDCQACWQEHLDNVNPNNQGSQDTHCPHACGDNNPSCPGSCPNECQ